MRLPRTSVVVVIVFAHVLAASMSMVGCIEPYQPYSHIAPGIWRGILELDVSQQAPAVQDGKLQAQLNFEEVTDGELPFLFEVIYDNDSAFHIEIINGQERIPVYDISFGRSKSRAKDSIRIDFPVYDTHIEALVEADVMEGYWVVHYRPNYRVHFVARHGQNWRFTTLRKPPVMDLSGRWACTFGLAENEPYPAIAEFAQTGNQLLGTFLTETGDYRFLEGTVQADKFYLSTFDGAHAFLFEGKVMPDSTLIGVFYLGTHYKTTWEAKRDPHFTLANPDSLTYLRPGYEKLHFTFLDTDGQLRSLSDPMFTDKAKLIQIMGTWCPNCHDETAFLQEYFQQHPDTNVVVVSIAFERYRDTSHVLRQLQRYKQKMGIHWLVLWGGYYDKKEAAQALPMLNDLISYPTLIFLDKNNRVHYIHTGFSGPATGAYEAFAKKFEKQLQIITPTSKKTSSTTQ